MRVDVGVWDVPANAGRQGNLAPRLASMVVFVDHPGEFRQLPGLSFVN